MGLPGTQNPHNSSQIKSSNTDYRVGGEKIILIYMNPIDGSGEWCGSMSGAQRSIYGKNTRTTGLNFYTKSKYKKGSYI